MVTVTEKRGVHHHPAGVPVAAGGGAGAGDGQHVRVLAAGQEGGAGPGLRGGVQAVEGVRRKS